MLSISQPLIDPEYLLRTAKLNYYTEGGEPVGRWHGSGQEVLGVSGEIKADDLRHLFRGVSVDGQWNLVQTPPEGRKRQCAWDLTFSADKSVSTAWAVGDERVRAAIEAAQLAAVLKALDFLEREAGLTRRGKGATRIEKAKLIFAVFQHGSSRAQDPQLHHHCMLLNLSVRDDGTTGSIVSKSVFRLKMIAGLVYRQELGHQLRKNLGFELRAQKTWLEIAGIPSAVIDMFSKSVSENPKSNGWTGDCGWRAEEMWQQSQVDLDIGRDVLWPHLRRRRCRGGEDRYLRNRPDGLPMGVSPTDAANAQ